MQIFEALIFSSFFILSKLLLSRKVRRSTLMQRWMKLSFWMTFVAMTKRVLLPSRTLNRPNFIYMVQWPAWLLRWREYCATAGSFLYIRSAWPAYLPRVRAHGYIYCHDEPIISSKKLLSHCSYGANLICLLLIPKILFKSKIDLNVFYFLNYCFAKAKICYGWSRPTTTLEFHWTSAKA